MKRHTKWFGILLLAGMLISCGGGGGTPTDPSFGWSAGSAMQSSAGASATFTFTGTSVRWIGARNRESESRWSA